MTVCYILAQAQGKISAPTACLSVIYSDCVRIEIHSQDEHKFTSEPQYVSTFWLVYRRAALFFLTKPIDAHVTPYILRCLLPSSFLFRAAQVLGGGRPK